MLLQLKDIIDIIDESIFIDDRTNGKFQMLLTSNELIVKKEWIVVYINSEYHVTPSEDDPVLCIGIVEKYEDWKKDKTHL